jgi:hypothetical protein
LGIVIMMLFLLTPTDAIPATIPASVGAVILAHPNDPYFSLAEEIAQREVFPIAHSLDEALSQNPVFLLWVVSPSRLSDEAMVEFGLAMRDRQPGVSTGIISGSTLEQARDLWQRASQVQGRRAFAVNNANPTAGIFQGRIIAFEEGATSEQPLTRANLKHALENADYLTFTGHGGEKWWELNGRSDFRASDVPPLPPAVISAASCNTFRIWSPGSIALRFTDRGAAVYTGFVYSPNSGYLIGAFKDLPFRYTWPDFPIGHVIQVQNRGALQGFAHFPYYHLLGDPRIALQTDPPYRLVSDREKGDSRTLVFADVPAGAIPVRIPDGARYSFVAIPGVTAAWKGDPFYNSRLQMTDIKGDKYVLFVHHGGDLKLRLRPHPPWHWVVSDLLVDSLDHTLLFLQVGSGDVISLAFAGLVLVATSWTLRRRKGAIRALAPAALTGLGFTALHGVYTLVRLGQVTITSKTLEFRPLSLAGTFLLTGCGAFLFLNARSRLAKGVALLVATFLAWAAAAFSLGAVAFSGWLSRAELGTAIWNSALGFMPLGTLALEFILFGVVFSLLQKWGTRPQYET